MSKKTLIYGANQIVQVVSNRERYLRGTDPKIKNLAILNKTNENDNLCIVSNKLMLDFFLISPFSQITNLILLLVE